MSDQDSALERLDSGARSAEQAGQLQEAEALYRQIIQLAPDHAGALHGLGLLAAQTGRLEEGARFLSLAVGLHPGWAECHNHLGLVRLQSGELDKAAAAFVRVIELEPEFPDAHNSLGVVLKQQGRVEQAIACYRRALALRPSFPEAANNLGVALEERGDQDEAIEAYRAALIARPSYAEAWSNLASALRNQGRIAEAIDALKRAASLTPGIAEIQYNLGIAYKAARQLAEAATSFRHAIAMRPAYPEAFNNLGTVLHEAADFDGAILAYQNALALRPDLAEAHNNLGRALKEQGRLDEAIASYRNAVMLRGDLNEAQMNLGTALLETGKVEDGIAALQRATTPDAAAAGSSDDTTIVQPILDAQWNYALALLLQGDFEAGLELYEVRYRARPTISNPEFLRAIWDGSPLVGRRILLFSEQGLGDTIQFIRYAPMVKSRGGEVIVLCQPELRDLLAGQLEISNIFVTGEELPPFDVCCPLMSLPHRFRTREDSIPHAVPYLGARPDLILKWSDQLKGTPEGLKVGIVWAGSPSFGNDRNRSITLATLTPLTELKNTTFFSLQKGSAAAQVQHVRDGLKLIDFTPDLHSFADTAAFIANLDLVIAVDTAVAHLAGAMGKPVLTLLPFMPDWRWQLHRDDSPWYPTMRLFRQRMRGDWTPVIRDVEQELKNWPKETAMG